MAAAAAAAGDVVSDVRDDWEGAGTAGGWCRTSAVAILFSDKLRALW